MGDPSPVQAHKRKVNLDKKIGPRRAMFLNWNSELEKSSEPIDPLLEAYLKEPKECLSQMLKSYRKAKNMTLRDAGEQFGLSHVAVWKFENGQKKVPQRIWEAIKVQ